MIEQNKGKVKFLRWNGWEFSRINEEQIIRLRKVKKKKLKQDEWKEIHTETQHGETAEY